MYKSIKLQTLTALNQMFSFSLRHWTKRFMLIVIFIYIFFLELCVCVNEDLDFGV
jgi:hypothetical protein